MAVTSFRERVLARQPSPGSPACFKSTLWVGSTLLYYGWGLEGRRLSAHGTRSEEGAL
jgi:hypothetical protein